MLLFGSLYEDVGMDGGGVGMQSEMCLRALLRFRLRAA